MNKQKMINTYRKHSAADKYILGFIYHKLVYAITVDEIMPRFLTVEQASRNQGENLRLRIRQALKEQLIRKGAKVIGTEQDLIQDKYNKGEIFEKMVTELYGQEWKKDNVPFWKDGDLTDNGIKYQIKLDSATLMNTKQVARLA